jgi:hypothetical protein
VFDGPPPEWVARDRPEEMARQTATLSDGSAVVVARFAGDGSGRVRVAVELPDVASRPETLVYWIGGPGPAAEASVASGVLLGSVRGTTTGVLALPAAATSDEPGRLLLYAVVHDELLGTVDLRVPGEVAP